MNLDDLGYVLYFEDVREGQELPRFERLTTIENWNRYAAVRDEYVMLHQDDDAGHRGGERGAFGMGNLRQAYLNNMLRECVGLRGAIRKIDFQHRAINNKGDTLTTWGRVTRKYEENGHFLVDVEIGVFNQDGVNITPGMATVELPSRR